MRLALISDTHHHHGKLALEKCDVIIHSGDATNYGTPEQWNAFLEWYGNLDVEKKLFVPGNHDFNCFDNLHLAKQECMEHGIHLLHDELLVYGGEFFYGTAWTPKFGNWAFMKEDRDLIRHYEGISEKTTVLITHSPPYGILDQNRGKLNCGSKSLLSVIETLPYLKLHTFGHIHEGSVRPNIEIRSGKTFVNASMLDKHHQPNNEITYVEI